MMIVGIYKIPKIKHALIIVAPSDEFSSNLQQLQKNKKRMECFEQILRSKDHRIPKEAQQWTLEVVSKIDFLKVLKLNKPKGKVSSNLSFHNPECLELLAINLVKTPEKTSDWTLDTPTALSSIPEEDIIEVFI